MFLGPVDTRTIVTGVTVFLVFGGCDSFAFGDYGDFFGCAGVEFVAGATETRPADAASLKMKKQP